MSKLVKSSIGFVVLLSLGAAGVVEPNEELQGHHEHPGISDASTSDAGHAHGDSDDHHETPNTPCHHHVVHCCCGHVHVMLAGNSLYAIRELESERLEALNPHSNEDPALRRFFHVPIA